MDDDKLKKELQDLLDDKPRNHLDLDNLKKESDKMIKVSPVQAKESNTEDRLNDDQIKEAYQRFIDEQKKRQTTKELHTNHESHPENEQS